MTCDLDALVVSANDPDRLAEFWGSLLGWSVSPISRDEVQLVPSDDNGFRLRFVATDVPKTIQNRMHFDLTSTSHDDQRQTVEKALSLGGRHVDVGQGPDATHVVLGDPEGNEFCVIEPGNNFLADCGFVGALACDGSQAVGYFWSAALGWPLVWDQDEETAIRSPAGGPKVTWGGPPLPPKNGRNRLHFDVVPAQGGDAPTELARLLSLGARTVEGTAGDERVLLVDPDDNEFYLVAGSPDSA